MIISVLLSSFGIVLRGIDTGYFYPKPKIPFPDPCPPNTTDVFPEDFPPHFECNEGFTGIFPDCIKKQKCRHPKIGTFPDCFLPPCPPGYSIGSYPKCKRPPNEINCPVGSTGVFPNCELDEATQFAAAPSPIMLELSKTKTTQIPLQISTETSTHEALPTTTPELKTTQASHDVLQVSPIPETSSEPTPETCEMGYTGTFPDCMRVKPKKCRRPSIGIFPDCFIPPCPPGYSIGTYPKCKKPSNELKCPSGSTGVFPNCEVKSAIRKCPEGGSICMIVPPSVQSSSQPPSTQHPIATVFDKMEWEDFKRLFNKTYANEIEEKKRQQIFLKNQDTVKDHNKLFEQGTETYSLAINEFSDRTHDEFLGVDSSKSASNQNEFYIHSGNRKSANDSKMVGGVEAAIRHKRKVKKQLNSEKLTGNLLS